MSHHRTPEIRARLARAHGHLHAVIEMLDAGRSYPEVLQQLRAVRAALDKATGVLLDDLIHECAEAPKRETKAAFDRLRGAVKILT